MGAPSDARSLRPPAERLRVLRELGSPTGADVAFCAALEATGNKTRLVVVERILRSGGVLPSDVTEWLERARQLVPLEHPNVARVRDAIDGTDEAYVVSDFIDGARWTDVVAAASGIPLDLALRALVDALAGLGALHNMRDAARQPMGLVHCGVSSETVLLGLDGVARILGASRMRGVVPGIGAHYLAPEVLLEDDAADARADVYSIGVLLWEALTGRRLFTETGVSAIVTAVLSGRIPRAEAPQSAPWAAPLVDVAARALSPDPAKRYASAAAMAAELRRIGGTKIVPSLRVAALVRSTFGDRIKARREELE
ncbi:MAG: protein kinase domain-containing protein, partial [Polyangiaceae bacterium]